LIISLFIIAVDLLLV